MVYLPTESSDVILILGFMTWNFLYLSFSTPYSTSLWRTDTFVLSKLKKPPVSIKPPPPFKWAWNKYPGGLNGGFTVAFLTGQSCHAWYPSPGTQVGAQSKDFGARRTYGDVTLDDAQRRFLAQHSVAMLEQCCNHSKQCRNNVATLCCAKNRRCESSRVT